MNSVAVHTNRKKPILVGISRWASLAHRWLGILLGLSFALWFASGTILSFVPFPSLEARERIAAREAIDLDKVRVPPATVLVAAGAASVEHLRLISVAGHPRYVVSLVDHPV